MITTTPKSLPPDDVKLKQLLANGMAEVVQQLIDIHKLEYRIDENGLLVDAFTGADLWLRKFITVDEETLSLKKDISTLSKHDDEVLIVGPTGTGKEALARALIGNRTGMTMCVNCAGLPENLIESELFGHERGAFTGADVRRSGLMTTAKDGLLFLDEIAELPIGVQGKLLRALQDKRIRRVGGKEEEPITCRIVCATNNCIATMVKEHTFRQDLYARISTFELHVKPLIHRMCDIEPITNSLPKGKEFYAIFGALFHSGVLSLEHNVRSIQQYVRRWVILGKV